jgi:regulatory protein
MKITAIKQQVKRKDRYSIYVDGQYAFSLSESGLLELGLASGREIDVQQLAELKKASGTDKAYGNALRYVAMRPRSMWELRTYLRRKDVEEPVAEKIIERLQRSGLVDDAAFARSWVASRRLLKSTSKRRIQMELKQKQVPEYIISQVLEEDETSERDSLRQLIAKKQARYPDRTKLLQYLARQGFSYDDITATLNEMAEAED